jgi:hypothetical protein
VQPEYSCDVQEIDFLREPDLRNKENGGARRNRTDDLLHAMQALSQLSYGPEPEATQLHPPLP